VEERKHISQSSVALSQLACAPEGMEPRENRPNEAALMAVSRAAGRAPRVAAPSCDDNGGCVLGL
jgi:hypothetical protein